MTNNALNKNHHRHHQQTIMRVRLNVLKVVVNIILCDEAGARDYDCRGTSLMRVGLQFKRVRAATMFAKMWLCQVMATLELCWWRQTTRPLLS